MATTVASIALQLLLLGTVVQLSYEIACHHTYRAVGHKFGQPLPAEFKKILEVDWEQPDISKKDGTRSCWEGTGCVTLRCVGANEVDLFRINGCLAKNDDDHAGARDERDEQCHHCHAEHAHWHQCQAGGCRNCQRCAADDGGASCGSFLSLTEWRNDDDDDEEENDLM
ncbi:hypothetical protein niasHT_021301 [Heterodera trifolii]|uniref:Secreted protein n=1 Tax=Heterodera trifolii TaxID=157864 RepID=A0ABD2K3G7_9BILA